MRESTGQGVAISLSSHYQTGPAQPPASTHGSRRALILDLCFLRHGRERDRILSFFQHCAVTGLATRLPREAVFASMRPPHGRVAMHEVPPPPRAYRALITTAFEWDPSPLRSFPKPASPPLARPSQRGPRPGGAGNSHCYPHDESAPTFICLPRCHRQPRLI